MSAGSARNERALKIMMAAFSAAGAGLMLYLTRLHYADSGSSVCDISAELSCNIVNQSVFSTLFGLPVSLLGMGYFLAVLGLLFWKRIKRPHTLIVLFSVFSLVFSLYLSAIEQFVLDSVCLFCELSKLMMLLILIAAARGAKPRQERLRPEWVIAAVIAGAIFSWVAYAVQKEPPLTEDYSNLARCLTEQGVSMYGAYWCPQCAKQKRAFGAAFRYVSEVECDPRGENARTERCVAMHIAKTPTWIQEAGGIEIKRLIGNRPPEELAREFGCSSD